jgi:O-antigen/teichoic acid export membrane protein
MLRQLSANSVIYTATSLMQKGTLILLMPLYTRYLDPTAYGVLAIVTAVNAFLSLAFTLNLTGAVTRFYFEYRDDPQTLARFWGSILTFVMLLSLLVGVILLLVGARLLRPFIGDVPFWPFVATGVVTTFFQPFFATYLAVLQTRNKANRYALISLSHFVLTTALTVALVVFLSWGAEGALIATLVATALFFVLSLWLMRSELRLCLDWDHLRSALHYSLPQVPHLLACQTTAVADRVILNNSVSAAAAGLYSVGGMVSMVIEVIASSVNRAYVPLSMSALKNNDPAELADLHALGSVVVAGFCLLGVAVGAFSRELIHLIAAPAFAPAADIVPLLVFGGVAGAIYYLFVNVLFFDRKAVRLLPLGTLTAAGLNVSLALALIPSLGLMGGAVANLSAQILSTILVAALARRFDPIDWEYGRYALVFAGSFALTWWLARLQVGGVILTGLAKLAGLVGLAPVLSLILWRRPFIFADATMRLLRRRPGEAAALFMSQTP